MHGNPFLQCAAPRRVEVVTRMAANEQNPKADAEIFFRELKALTVFGYYTTKIGIHDELQYKGNRILQEYVGCDDQGPATS